MQTWLAKESHDRDSLLQGAEMVLKLTRNMSMYQTIIRRPERFESKIRYELNKFLPMRLEKMTLQDVKVLDAELMPQIDDAIGKEQAHKAVEQAFDGDTDTSGFLPIASGIRPDHDSLPENIKGIWTDNKERWFKIKQLYNYLLPISQPCDRYEYLKVLKDTWYKYKQEMARYDDYRLTADGGSKGDGAAEQTPALTPEQEKELKNADSYISKNMPQLQMLVSAAKEEEFNEEQINNLENLRQRIQQRVDVLLKYGRTLTEERSEQLKQCDIKLTLDTPEDNEQGKESE